MKSHLEKREYLPVVFANYLTLNEYELATQVYYHNYYKETRDLSYIYKLFEKEKDSKLLWYLICEFLFQINSHDEFLKYLSHGDLSKKWNNIYPSLQHSFENVDSCMLEIEKKLFQPDQLLVFFQKEREYYIKLKRHSLFLLKPFQYHFVKYCHYNQLDEYQFYCDHVFEKMQFKTIPYFNEFYASCIRDYHQFKTFFESFLLETSYRDHFILTLFLEKNLSQGEIFEFFSSKKFSNQWIDKIPMENEFLSLKCDGSTWIKTIYLNLKKFDDQIFKSIPEGMQERVFLYLLNNIRSVDVLEADVSYHRSLVEKMKAKIKYLEIFPEIGMKLVLMEPKMLLTLCIKNQKTDQIKELTREFPELSEYSNLAPEELILPEISIEKSEFTPFTMFELKESFSPNFSIPSRQILFVNKIYPIIQHAYKNQIAVIDAIEANPEKIINLLNMNQHFDLSRNLLKTFGISNQYFTDKIELDQITHHVKIKKEYNIPTEFLGKYFKMLKPNLKNDEYFYRIFGKHDKLLKYILKSKNLYIGHLIELSIENLILNEEMTTLFDLKQYSLVFLQPLFLKYAEKALQDKPPVEQEKGEFLISSVVSLMKKTKIELNGNKEHDEKIRSKHIFSSSPNIRLAIQFFQLSEVTEVKKQFLNFTNYYILEQIFIYFKDEKLLKMLDVYKMIVFENCQISFQDLLDKPPRSLRDRLIEEDHLAVALQLSKTFKVETDPIWIAWGLSSLKFGNYRVAREKFKYVTHLSKQTLVNIFNILTDWNEIRYYLTFVKDENDYLDILLKNFQYQLALGTNKNFFVILKHAIDFENLSEFMPLLSQQMLMTCCKYLSEKRDFEHLYQFQKYLKDDNRCALTLISFYLETRSIGHLDSALDHFSRSQKAGTTDILTYQEISNYIGTISLQKEVAKHLNQFNDPHLFGNQKMKYEIVECLFLKQFVLAYKLVNMFQLNMMKIIPKFENNSSEVIGLLKDRYPEMDDVYLFYAAKDPKVIPLILNKNKKLAAYIKCKDWRNAYQMAQAMNSREDMLLINEGTKIDPAGKQIHEYTKKFLN